MYVPLYSTFRRNTNKNEQYYTLNAHSVRVLRESWIPEPTGYRASPPDTENVEIAISAQDEFDNFTTKKRTDARPTILAEKPEASTSKVDAETPVASSSKTAEKKERKKATKKQPVEFEKSMGADIEMDTSV